MHRIALLAVLAVAVTLPTWAQPKPTISGDEHANCRKEIRELEGKVRGLRREITAIKDSRSVAYSDVSKARRLLKECEEESEDRKQELVDFRKKVIDLKLDCSPLVQKARKDLIAELVLKRDIAHKVEFDKDGATLWVTSVFYDLNQRSRSRGAKLGNLYKMGTSMPRNTTNAFMARMPHAHYPRPVAIGKEAISYLHPA